MKERHDLHVFHVGMIGLAVRPLWIAHYSIVAVGQHMGVCGLEEKIWTRHKDADHPNDAGNAKRRPFAHPRSQRTHDGHVAKDFPKQKTIIL